MDSVPPGGTGPRPLGERAESVKELTKKVLPLIVTLAVTILGWYLLYCLAYDARINSTIDDYNQALTWARELLGLAAIVAGFFGVSTATLQWKTDLSQTQAIYLAGGLAGILAGATLLNVGGWPIPAALAAMAIGTITICIRQTWR